MIFTPTPLKGSYVIVLEPFTDARGWFARTYDKNLFESIGHHGEWVQMNHSFTGEKGTIRGMHYQLPPHRESKLVRCISGSVFDVIVDIRADSATFLHWYGIRLSAEEKNMIYIPQGFAHGFQTLTADCELLYSHSAAYVPGAEGGLAFNDGRLGIAWPLEASILSERDRSHPFIEDSFNGL